MDTQRKIEIIGEELGVVVVGELKDKVTVNIFEALLLRIKDLEEKLDEKTR